MPNIFKKNFSSTHLPCCAFFFLAPAVPFFDNPAVPLIFFRAHSPCCAFFFLTLMYQIFFAYPAVPLNFFFRAHLPCSLVHCCILGSGSVVTCIEDICVEFCLQLFPASRRLSRNQEYPKGMSCTHPDVRAFDSLRCCVSCGFTILSLIDAGNDEGSHPNALSNQFANRLLRR